MNDRNDVASYTGSRNTGPKQGIFRRAVDSFKPPIGQVGYFPERSITASGGRVPARQQQMHHASDPEKGPIGTPPTHDAGMKEKSDGEGGTVVTVNDDYDDNGGLKRALHGRHLQVCV